MMNPTEQEIAKAESIVDEVLTLPDVLNKLADWCEHLMNHHDCDATGYEELSFAIPAARVFAVAAQSRLATSDVTRLAREAGKKIAESVAIRFKESIETDALLPENYDATVEYYAAIIESVL